MFRATFPRCLMVALVLAFVTTSMLAQTKPATKDAGSAESETASKFRPRLPNNYGKLGITAKQKEEIYALQKKYYDELEVLVEQIKTIKAQRDSQIQAVLTPEQKATLAKLNAKPDAGTTAKAKGSEN